MSDQNLPDQVAQAPGVLPPLPDRDLADSYLKEKAQPAGDNPVLQALRRRMGAPSVGPEAPKSEISPKGDARPGGDAGPEPREGSPAAEGAAPAAAAAPEPPHVRQMFDRLRQPRVFTDFAAAVAGGAWATAKDVYTGAAIEAAPAAFRGANKALGNFFASADQLGTWLNENVADLRLDKAAPADDNPLRHLADAAKDFTEWTPEAQSFTGKTVEVVSQWITGNAVMGRLATALGMPAGKVTQTVRDMATGATAFDPKGERLSNLVDEGAANPLTDWLKAKPGDSDAEGRLKNALEVGGLGALTDGVILGLKTLRGAGELPTGSAATAADALKAGEKGGGVSAEMEAKAKDFLAGVIPDVKGPINLARIAGPEDIKAAIDDVAKQLPEATPETFKQTIAGAREIGMTPEQIIGGVQGGALDARQITAARMVMRSAAEQLTALADKAATIAATPQDLAAFNKAYAMTYGILQQVRGSSAEIGRALSAHRIMAASEPEALKAVQALLDQVGGPEATRDMALKIASLKDPAKVAELVGATANGTVRDNLTYAYMNLLVSNPASHVANLAGNGGAMAIDVWERWLAGQVRSVGNATGLTSGEGVAEGEALAKLYGQQRGAWDGLMAAGRTLKTGVQDFGAAKEISTAPAVALGEAETRGPSDYLKMLLPARWLGAEDQVFKWMHYRGELSALALRQGQGEGMTGPALKAFIDDTLMHPPPGLHEQAVQAATQLTFNRNPLGPFASSLSTAMRNWTFEVRPGIEIPIGKVIMPFTQTPANIFKWNFERFPGLGLLAREMRQDLAAGGAARDLAIAKQATGAIVAGLTWELVQQGVITGGGPQEPELRGNVGRQTERGNYPAYSMHIGDKYYGYDRFDTPGMLMGTIADVGDIMTWARDEDREQMGAAIALAFSRAVVSRSYMQGVAGMINAISDPARYGEPLAGKIASSPVPALLSNLNLAADPTKRNTKTAESSDPLRDTLQDLANSIRARTPGLSQALPPLTDLWGHDMKVNGAWLPGVDPDVARLISPVKVSAVKDSPIDAELARLRLRIEPVREAVQMDVPVGGRPGPAVPIRLLPGELYRYSVLQGQEVKDPRSGLNLEETLNQIVGGKGQLGAAYRGVNDDGRSNLIREQVQAFRQMARAALLQEFPEIGEATQAKRDAAIEASRPPGAGGAPAPEPAAGPTAAPANNRTNKIAAPRLN